MEPDTGPSMVRICLQTMHGVREWKKGRGWRAEWSLLSRLPWASLLQVGYPCGCGQNPGILGFLATTNMQHPTLNGNPNP